MNPHLLVHNILFAFDGVISVIFALFVYFKDRKAEKNITFALAFISIATFCFSHLAGVTVTDPYLSRNIFMFNISNIFIACFLAHCCFSIVGVVKKQRLFLIAMYTTGICLTIIYLMYPNTFLLPSVPKMYFPNYYVPGSLHWLMRVIFNGIVPGYFLGYLIYAYTKADAIMKNRLKYFFVALFVGYASGSLAIFLVYNIQVDPVLAGPFIIILAFPMAYAIVKYNLMDIRVLAKRALVFGFITAISSFLIFLVGFANSYIGNYYPGFPSWALPIVAGLAASIIGIVIWKKLREADVVKYEFITVVTHKLRTPLTSIKWSAENLTTVVPAEHQQELGYIKQSTERLVELTNILVDVSSEDQEKYLYRFEPINIGELCKELVLESLPKAMEKNIVLKMPSVPFEHVFVDADRRRLQFMFQIIIDNAISYTPAQGQVSISISQKRNTIQVLITDTGIGMTKEESHLIFSRFYRTDAARRADTEGMGIGLFVARRIADRHNGTIVAQSEGVGKGTTFTVSLPIAKAK